jgi:TonB-dependent SusC/RagA subfamily outer membrane receptor
MMSMTARATLAGLATLLAACSAGRPRSPTPDPVPATKEEASTVDAKDIEREAGRDPLEALQGRVAGVEVSRTAGGGIAVRIRGSASFYGGTDPLYVLDGVPFTPGPNGSIVGLNPHDIESIKVLKDAPDTAIYGVRGANGVIVITTKKPGRRKP